VEDPGHDWKYVKDVPVGGGSQREIALWKCSKCGHKRHEYDRPKRDLKFPTNGTDMVFEDMAFYTCEELMVADVMEA
jgi:hypothetical protein